MANNPKMTTCVCPQAGHVGMFVSIFFFFENFPLVSKTLNFVRFDAGLALIKCQYFEIPDHLSSNLYFLYCLAFLHEEKCQGSALWPILPPCIASFKNVSGLFSAPDVGLYCTLLCRLFLSGFPRSELRTLWHSRSYECAISQATWHRAIALNSLNPLKLQGPYTQQSILELQHW